MKEKISVLITCYNSEKYIDQAIKSVVEQKTSFPFKIIIGDDGSNDGTIKIIEKWESQFPTMISHIIQLRDLNKKYIAGSRASKNRLSLLNLVNTDYFIFLDGDDYWTSNNKLQIQYEILESTENEDCVGCAHQIKMFNENAPEKFSIVPRFVSKESKYVLTKYWKNYYFHTDTILFRSKYIKYIRKDLLEDFFNDNLITYSFMQFGKMYFLPICLADYRQNDQGIWAGEKRVIGIFRNILSFDIENKINSDYKRIGFVRHFIDFTFYVKNHNDFLKIDSLYYDLATKYCCDYSLKALKNEPILSNDWKTENKIAIKLKLLHILYSVNRMITGR